MSNSGSVRRCSKWVCRFGRHQERFSSDADSCVVARRFSHCPLFSHPKLGTQKNDRSKTSCSRFLDISCCGCSGSQSRCSRHISCQWKCEREGIVGGDEGPVGGVAQVVCHGVKVVGVHGEEGKEEDGEMQGEVKGEVEQLREKRSSWMVCG